MRHTIRGALVRAAALVALAALALGGCGSSDPVEFKQPAAARFTVAMAEFAQESNSFSPVLTTIREFESAGLLYGQEVMDQGATKNTALGGFVRAVSDHGDGQIAILPILRARAISGGPVERAVYEKIKGELVDGLKAAPHLDGVYLALHGAMGVEGMRDPEGDLLAAVREALGSSIPIGVSHDLHANVTALRAELATFIVGYKTNPHRDFYRTGYDSGEILAGAVLGKIDPVMSVRKMRLLKGGGMNIDFMSPMTRLFRFMRKAEKQKDVLSVSTFPVHIWLDDEELGWTTIAVTDASRELADKTADAIADVAWSIRAVPHAKSYTASEAVAVAKRRWLARKTGALVICDVADAVGTGSPGENTWILKALVEEAPTLVSYVPIRDAEVAREVWGKSPGEKVTVTVGGKLETKYNRPFEFSGEVVRTTESALGKTVILRDRGVHLIVSELAPSATHPRFFNDLGLRVGRADVLVVKNLFPFRYNFIAVNRGTLNVETPGTSGVNVFELGYTRIPRPIYPLDDLESWR